MLAFDKLLDRRLSACSNLMTWEFRSTFEGEPSLSEVKKQFERELPECVKRSGGVDYVHLWPMISFNAVEGRLWRYLVALPLCDSESESERARCTVRYLPEQIALVALANEYMMTSQEGNSGNCTFWALFKGTLYLLVYFEGRLCHWSEEAGYSEDLLEERLNRFTKFLEQDSLFSRGKHFSMVHLEVGESFSRELFLKASRDPFFRRLNLNECQGRRRAGSKGGTAACLLGIVGLTSFFLWTLLSNPNGLCENEYIPDVPDTMLVDPPVIEMVEELREPVSHREVARVEPKTQEMPSCVMPKISVKGIVGGKLAIVEMDGKRKMFSVGDSLTHSPGGKDSFFIQGIERDRLVLSCLGMTQEVFAR